MGKRKGCLLMSVLIGHASCDENGKAQGGKAGDQTAKEICTRKWYNGDWHTVLRHKDPEKAEKAAQACEAACANPNVGYDQYQRNTLRKQAKAVGWDLSKIKMPCECDCSSLQTVCEECAGIDIPYNGANAPTTSTMSDAFELTGELVALHDKKYLTSDAYLERGDVLIKKGHTVRVLQNGSKTRKAVESKVTVEVSVLKKGSKGEGVRALQGILNALGYDCGEADGSFGSKTLAAVKKFQKENGLVVDGSVGKATWTALLN